MDILLAPDLWLISRVFEPVAHAVKRHTGIGNFALSRAVLMLWPASVLAIAYPFQDLANTLVATATVAAATYFFVTSLQSEKNCGSENPSRSDPMEAVKRLGAVFLVVLAVLYDVRPSFIIAVLGYVGWMYFEACDPTR